MNKMVYLISAITAFLSTLLGDFWFLFLFLLLLNIVDYITGIIKARYLKQESSIKARDGFVKKFLIWTLIALGFGLGIVFKEIGKVLGINLSFMMSIGWFLLAHCIINEFRSILENIVQLDKGYLVPNWLIRGLEVTEKIIDNKVNNVIDNLDDKKES